MTEPVAGFELPLLLFGGFRSLIDDLHIALAAQGHTEMRPAHGFALQAIGSQGATAADLGRRLGVSKQAAGKTIDRLVQLGYVSKAVDRSDARRQTVQLTDRGWDVLRQSALIFDQLRAAWAQRVGERALTDLEESLRRVVGPAALRLDTAGWFGSV
ncbi:MAG: MarR family transcriptional regulator [Actinomycetota bacterium]|nr:MarR family transcriptional regulator [Actinomycetota bacterium]